MWLPSSTDLLLLSALGVVAVFPQLLKLAGKIRLPSLPSTAGDKWRNNAVQSLLDLQRELEQRGLDKAVGYSRQLIWEIIGGSSK